MQFLTPIGSEENYMPSSRIKRATASFHTQGRLLQELGERLVSAPEVALLELIKNSYDADASFCKVISGDHQVEIIDDGHGMTEKEFLANWMHIATPDKQRANKSKIYGRTVTGSKGIGRFAVRYLGSHLKLETIALDGNKKTKLSVSFHWEKIDAAHQLHAYKIPYEVKDESENVKTGTRLIIENLRRSGSIELDKDNKTDLLSIVNPYRGLESGGFSRFGKSKKDPGFNVIFPEDNESEKQDIATALLTNYFARLTIKYESSKLEYKITKRDGKILEERQLEYLGHISNGLFADIRFCPRRAGMFKNTGFDGRKIFGWLKGNGGVGIVDHGFRIRPYGFPEDDWLNLSLDSGHSAREWRGTLMNDLYPMSEEAKSNASKNPMLYLPMSHQLIGAVFVESTQDSSIERPKDLTPAMDREGFLKNEAFDELRDIVRIGLEILAFADHREKRRIEKEEADKAAKEMRDDFKEAIQYIETIPSLSESDKHQVTVRFQTLAKELDDVKEYQKISSSKLETIALLGVLAGFMTHEMKRLIHDFDSIIGELKKIDLSSSAQETLSRVEKVRNEVASQVQFAGTFIANVQAPKQVVVPLNVKSQINRVLERFRYFTKERNVLIECDIDDDLSTPPLPVALYSGVLLNLYTNALKAIFGGQKSTGRPSIKIMAWNDSKYHVLEVADTGVGVPPNLRDRIWDPLYTTTSGGSTNPLGSGMGLGLSLVRGLIKDIRGKIELLNDPPPGYNTCFKVSFPR